MEKKVEKSRLAGIPAWAMSLMTFFTSIGLFGIFEHIQLPKPIDTDIVVVIIYVIFLTAACFIICKTHPKSIWYTPFICNTFIIFILIGESYSNPDLPVLILLSACIVLSVIGAIIGARTGRR